MGEEAVVWRVSQRDLVMLVVGLGLWTWAPRVLLLILVGGLGWQHIINKRREMESGRRVIGGEAKMIELPWQQQETAERVSMKPMVLWGMFALLSAFVYAWEPGPVAVPESGNLVVAQQFPAQAQGPPTVMVPAAPVMNPPVAAAVPTTIPPRGWIPPTPPMMPPVAAGPQFPVVAGPMGGTVIAPGTAQFPVMRTGQPPPTTVPAGQMPVIPQPPH